MGAASRVITDLTLDIQTGPGSSPASPDESDGPVETWRDNDGTISGYGFSARDNDWLLLPGVGTFNLGPSGSSIVAYSKPGVSEATLRDAFRRTALPLALQARGLEVLHASAVVGKHGVIALAGRSTMGKSTLAYALSRGGFPLWADDAVPVVPCPGGAECIPIPAAIRLRPESRQYFAADSDAKDATAWSALTSIPEAVLQPLAAIVVLERSSTLDEPVRIERLAGAAALTAVLAHAYAFTLEQPRQKSRMLQQYAAIVREVPVSQLSYRTGLEQMPRLLATITSLDSDQDGSRI